MGNKAVFGMVRAQTQAEGLIADLESKGFDASDVSVLFPGAGQRRDFAIALASKAPQGAVIGGVFGGLFGLLTGVLAGIGMISPPGLGLLVSAGPILAALSSAAVWAAIGALLGAIVGHSVPEIRARAYEGKLTSGNILVAVHTEDGRQIEIAKSIFRTHAATDISVTNERSVPGGPAAAAEPATSAGSTNP